jgi:hypothetical protein
LPETFDRWTLTREVDYMLWWLSRQPRGAELDIATLHVPKDDSETEGPPWKLVGNVLVHS